MLYFEREIEFYVSTVDTGFNTDNTVKLSVLKGTSIGYESVYTTNYSHKISNTPDRLADTRLIGYTNPTLKFTTYSQPYDTGSAVTVPEKLLLNSLFGGSGTEYSDRYEHYFSSVNTLPELYIYIKFGTLVYKLSNMIVEALDIKLTLNEIVRTEWDMQGLLLEKVASAPDVFTDYSTGLSNHLVTNFSKVDVTYASSSGKLPITSGNISFKNSIEIFKRHTLDSRQVVYLGHAVKDRKVEMNFTGYLKSGSGSNLDLFNELNTDIDYNSGTTAVTLTIGKADKNISVYFPNAVLTLPKPNISDIITSNIKIIPNKKTTVNDDTLLKYVV